MMLRVILWKEYREQRSIWLALALVAAASLLGANAALGEGHQAEEGRDLLAVVTVVLAWTYGLVCGAILLAGEREAGTQAFLDTLPAARLRLWGAKCLSGGLFLLLMLVVLGCLSGWLGLAPREHPIVALTLVMGGLAGFGWGLFFSALTRSVLAAIGLAIVVQVTMWSVVLIVVLLVGGLIELVTAWTGVRHAAPYITAVLWVIVPLPLSALVYSRVDRERRLLAWRSTAALAGWWQGWRQSLWLSWVQVRGLVLGVLLFGLVASPLVIANIALFWPALTLAVAALCGVTVFLDEQDGAYRFLGDQRFPLWGLWLVKVLMRWALAGLAMLVLVLPFGFVQTTQEGQAVRPLLAITFAFAGLMYGFTVGHLCGLIFRKGLVALVVSVGLAAVLAGLWAPSILLGGIHPWQILAVPLVLLVCARMVLPAWASDRLGSRRTIGRLAGVGVLCVALTALGLWYRVVEVPDIPVPEDFEAFVEGLPRPVDDRAGQIVRSVCERLGDLERQWLRTPVPKLPPQPLPVATYPRQCVEVIEGGWPVARGPGLGAWLDEVFGNDLWKELARIDNLPTGVVEDPRRLTAGSRLRCVEPSRLAGTLLAARGLQMQKEANRPEVFVAHLKTSLALVRNLEHGAPSAAAAVARQIEADQLTALDRWLEQLPNRADLLRKALEVVRQHVARAPLGSSHQHFLADYLVALRSLDDPQDWLHLYSGTPQGATGSNLDLAVLATAWTVPWERQRHERILRHVYWANENHRRGNSFGARLPPVPRVTFSLADTVPRRRCRLDAAILKLALRLYQAEKGRPAATLAALVPTYLPTVPADPFDSAPFRYRLSAGEDILWPTPGPGGGTIRNQQRQVPPGQGILWSVGEDGRDDGGKRRCEPRRRSQKGEDVIFLVPLPAKK